jgi:probable F420-dependent oxidoreductase
MDVVFGLTVADDVAGYQAVADHAIGLGYRRIWLPETYRVDPVSFAGWLATAHPGHPIGLGPFPAPLRTGPQLAMLAATLAGIGTTDLEAIVGSSSPAMVEGWHNRPKVTVAAMASLIEAVRAACSGEATRLADGAFRTEGFTNGLGPVHLPVGMAAFGPRMLRLAGRVADRVAINMIGPASLPAFMAEIDEGARAAGRPRPPVTIWAHVCLDPTEEAVEAAKRFVSAYVRVPGYDRNFVRQGFGELVAAAKAAPSVREVRAMIPERLLVESLGFGTLTDIRARLDAYRELGAEIALVPATTIDPGARRTLAALAS